jgi:hypothetical protein
MIFLVKSNRPGVPSLCATLFLVPTHGHTEAEPPCNHGPLLGLILFV